MTLLITLACESVVHQSSDYRISNWAGNVVETANGTKQLFLSNLHWAARIAFTGIAFDGQDYSTRNWIEAVCLNANENDSPEALVEKLAERGLEELRRVSLDRRHLTVIVTFVVGGRCRLFLVSNFEAPRQNRRRIPLDVLQWFEVSLDEPTVLVNGASGPLRRWEVRALEQMFRSDPEPNVIRDRMADANRTAAQRGPYAALISEGCWVSSMFADGKELSRNYGEVPGIPGQLMSGFNMGEFLRKTLHPAPGKQIALRSHTAMFGAKFVPLPPPIGEPRDVRFSTSTSSVHATDPAGRAVLPRITFQGREGAVRPRKNEQVTAVLGTITLEIDPLQQAGAVTAKQFEITNVPTVDSGRPRTWAYPCELHGGGGAYTLTVCQLSTALRRAHCTGLDVLGPNEELVLAAPVDGLLLHATPQEPKVSADVIASFLIRDFPELTDSGQRGHS